MSTEFTREDRYIVFKLSDVERYLTDADRAHLAMMKNEIDAGRDCANKPPFKGLIVESDWPEYEPTWKAIEARVTGAQPAQKAVAYLDLGVGGYMDIGTDLTDEQLASLPKGRHMLGIVGTYGVDGYVSAQQCKNCNGMGDRFDPSGEKIPCDLCESNLEEIRVLVAEAAHDIISGSDFWLSTSLAAKKIYALPGAQPAPSVPDTHNDMVVGLDYQGAMSCARQRAKKEAGLLYPEGDARKEEKERELAGEYYRQYTTPNPGAKP